MKHFALLHAATLLLGFLWPQEQAKDLREALAHCEVTETVKFRVAYVGWRLEPTGNVPHVFAVYLSDREPIRFLEDVQQRFGAISLCGRFSYGHLFNSGSKICIVYDIKNPQWDRYLDSDLDMEVTYRCRTEAAGLLNAVACGFEKMGER
jgi:hypothetical protein